MPSKKKIVEELLEDEDVFEEDEDEDESEEVDEEVEEESDEEFADEDVDDAKETTENSVGGYATLQAEVLMFLIETLQAIAKASKVPGFKQLLQKGDALVDGLTDYLATV